MDSATRLQKILVDSPVGVVLPAIALLNLPNWWLAGGAVRNTVWRSLFGNNCQLVINDFDIAFFDALGDRSQELTAKATLTEQFPDYKFDVKNQASFARWRPGRRPYSSTEDGVSDWLSLQCPPYMLELSDHRLLNSPVYPLMAIGVD
jgi:hypothetical protein